MDLGALPTPAEMVELSGADLDRALVELETAHRKLEAAYVALLDRADHTGRFRGDGHASVRGWAMALTNSSPVETRRRLQTMRALRDLPEAGRHLADGTIGVEQVREIAKLHANPRLRDLVIDGDARLVRHAGKSFESFSETLARWAQFGDPHGAEQRHAAAHDRRDAFMFERDGVVHVHAKCGTGQGAALMEIFQRQCDAEFLADWEQAQADAAAADDGSEPMSRLARTDAQRRMDALHRLVLRGVVAAPDAATPEPLVNIVMTKAEHEAELAAMMGGEPGPSATVDDIDAKRCETTTGITISARDAVIASMIGYVEPSGDRLLRPGHRTRSPPPLHRRRPRSGAARRTTMSVAQLRSGVVTSSDRPHSRARSRGLTTPENGGPACGRHNRIKSRGYTAHCDADGIWHVHRADGTELTEPAAA